MFKSIDEINTDKITEDTVFVIKVDITNMSSDSAGKVMNIIREQAVEKLKPGRVLIVDNTIDITKLSMSQLMNPVEGTIIEESK